MTETSERNYDVNTFDWNSEDEVCNDQQHILDVENLVREAIIATTPVEKAWLRPSKVDGDRARPVFNVPYSLDKDQKTYLEELVGDTRTLTYNAVGYHDHPISHCLLEISEDMVVNKFNDEPFVSVWGNANRHRKMGHVNAKVVSDRNVPHDWFRNRGMEEVVTDVTSFVNAGGHLKYRIFMATHALYYMSLDDVASWMGGNPNAEFHAIIHRHNKSKGHINKGELSYTVDSDGYVEQRNPITGFIYGHKSMEPLFHADSCRVHRGKQGLAWDISKLAGDNYHVKFVLCDVEKAAISLDPWNLIKTDRNVSVRGDVTTYRCLSFEWYVFHASDGEVVLEDVELYDRLRRNVAGKERTSRAWNELMNLCRRLANKNDIISIHQGFAHEIAPELMPYYVNAAFYADVQREYEVAIMYHRENKNAVDALNKYYTTGTVPLDLTNVAKVGRAVMTPFTTLSGLLKSRPELHNTDLFIGMTTVATRRRELPSLFGHSPPKTSRAAEALTDILLGKTRLSKS